MQLTKLFLIVASVVPFSLAQGGSSSPAELALREYIDNEMLLTREIFETEMIARDIAEITVSDISLRDYVGEFYARTYDELETRAAAQKVLDGAKKAKTAAGLISDGVGLATDIASGDLPKGIFDAVKLTVDGIISAFNAIKDAEKKDAVDRGAFTQNSVATLRKSHPQLNFVMVHTKHNTKFDGTQGKDWYHDHRELKVHFPVGSTIGFEIYGFKSGEFTRTGDGGYQNWAFDGNIKTNDQGGKHLVFGAIGKK